MKTNIIPKEEILWLNGYAAYAVMYMREIPLLKDVRFARFLQRSLSSRLTK